MNIGGFQETSLLDYPGKLAAIVWTAGCNFRCPFCYNKQLVFEESEKIPLQRIFTVLDERKGKLDAVSITGGEPLMHEELYKFIKTIKEKGYLVKVDTNGSFPHRLKNLLDNNLLDYVAMDIKATKEKYAQVAGIPVDVSAIDQSISMIRQQAPEYEFKTTVVPRFHTKEDILNIAQWIQGSKRYYLQQFKVKPPLVTDALASENPYAEQVLLDMCDSIKPHFQKCAVRGI
jgi:pyruvate formate lyase activating enzyme